jgi:hypothetical protein
MRGHAPPCRLLGRSAFQIRLPFIHELPEERARKIPIDSKLKLYELTQQDKGLFRVCWAWLTSTVMVPLTTSSLVVTYGSSSTTSSEPVTISSTDSLLERDV